MCEVFESFSSEENVKFELPSPLAYYDEDNDDDDDDEDEV